MAGSNVLTLAYIKRYPESETSRKWRKKRVNIFTVGKGWWKPQASGYTDNQREAWMIPLETAIAHTAHISQKADAIEYHLCDILGNTL